MHLNDLGDTLAGSAYSRQLFASGAASITWSLESGALPTGVNLSPGGLLAGTPTVPGPYQFLVKATDASNSANFAFKQFILNVSALSITNASTPPSEMSRPSIP